VNLGQNLVYASAKSDALLAHVRQIGPHPIIGRADRLFVGSQQPGWVPAAGTDLGDAVFHQTGTDHRDLIWSRHRP
jgi:hypothetical protein